LQFFTQIRGVDHRGVFINGVGEFFRRIGENQLGASEPDGAVESAAASYHDDFMFQSGGIGKLPDIFVIGAGHTSRRGCGHRAR
jgi:hypothetical protein